MSKIILANWKMNGSQNLIEEFNHQFVKDYPNLIICPSSLMFGFFNPLINLGAQDCSIIEHESGAFTGEMSAKFLANNGIKYILVGHSERRQLFNETNQTLKQKLLQICDSNAIPIFCIGENKHQYDNNQTIEILEEQLSILKDMSFTNEILIAYEPVWSIGTGIIPSTEIITPILHNINKIITKTNNSIEKKYKLLYGGSVTEQNIEQINKWPVEGFLVGGASLDADKLKLIYYKANS